jgi:tetratricopeptide (TPR) repeat protein
MEIHELVKKTLHLIECGSYNNALALLVIYDGEAPATVETCLLGIKALHGLNRIEEALIRAENWLNGGQQAYHPQVLRWAGILSDSLGRRDKAIAYLSRAQVLLPDAGISARLQAMTAPRPKLVTAVPETPPSQAQPGAKPTAAEKVKKLAQIFTDWSDALACCVWLSQLGLLYWFFIKPYWQGGIALHPTWQLLGTAFNALHKLQLPMHLFWLLGIALVVAMSGMLARHQACQPSPTETIEFDSIRRVWSYHLEWSAFLLAVAASLYLLNDAGIKHQIEAAYRLFLANVLGLAAIGLGIYCFWLLLPAARPRVQLIRTVGHKGNRLVIAQGVLLPSVKSYLPQSLLDAQVGRSLGWLMTFTGRVVVNLDDGESITLVAPCSLVQVLRLVNGINTAINDAKTIVSHKSGFK